MKDKIGQYLRDTRNNIGKIVNIRKEPHIVYDVENVKGLFYAGEEDDVVKFAETPQDLVMVGDLVKTHVEGYLYDFMSIISKEDMASLNDTIIEIYTKKNKDYILQWEAEK